MEHSREQQQKQQQQQAAAAAALHRRVATIVRHIAMPISSSSSSCQKQQQRPYSKQLLPVSDQQQIHVELCPCSSSGSETSERRRSSNKYERLHGSVSRELPVWTQPAMLSGPPFEDILYEKAQDEAIAKITINRPERRNAFRPLTVMELKRAFDYARDDPEVGVVIFTGKGTEAFCSGGDQAVRGKHGYVGSDNIGRLNILDVQVQIRRLPKPVIAMNDFVSGHVSGELPGADEVSGEVVIVNSLSYILLLMVPEQVAGYAVGGGHVLHMVCDLTIAADNAVFGQTGPKVGSFDGGYGCSMMARLIGQKRAREMWFLARFYSAQEAINMGLINTVVPLEKLEEETVVWCRKILQNSPMAIRLLKSALNAVEDGHAGLQELAGNATLLFYGSDEAIEGKTAYLEGRKPDFSKFPRLP